MNWTNGEKGPTCFCGWPTRVVVGEDSVDLLCFGHTREAGALFALPLERPDKWPELSHE